MLSNVQVLIRSSEIQCTHTSSCRLFGVQQILPGLLYFHPSLATAIKTAIRGVENMRASFQN